MEKKSYIDHQTFKLDDFFTTQEQRDENKKEKIEIIDLDLIDDFPEHPFKVRENEDLIKLQESIKLNGVLEPIIVRKKGDRYEIVSGHRRKKASELIGKSEIPCIVRNMSDDEATIYMVDSNMHREFILPSEKAKAYKMKLDAMKHQGIRNDLTSFPVGNKLTSAETVGKEMGESKNQVYRFIRLNYLIPELLDMVDNSVLEQTPSIALRPAVELSYLKESEQKLVLDSINYTDSTPSHAQAIQFRKLSENNQLTEQKIDEIMSQEKPNQIPRISLSEDKIRKVIPKSLKINDMEDFVIKACEYYGRHLREKNIESR